MNWQPSSIVRLSALPLIVAVAACSISSEDDHGMPAPPPSSAAINSVTPQSGTVGTQVRIQASGFPTGGSVVIGFGLPNSEYSVLENATADASGAVSAVVEVPSWATAGRSYVFVVADTDNQPKAVSGLFQVSAGSSSLLRIEGRVTNEGVECLAIRDADGRLYTLTRGISGLEPGDRVVVEGTVAEMSFCMQGTTINVRTIKEKN